MPTFIIFGAVLNEMKLLLPSHSSIVWQLVYYIFHYIRSTSYIETMIKASRRKKSITPKSRKSVGFAKELFPYTGPNKPKTNAEGKISEWKSNCEDGRELKVYVENGCCDNMTAKTVMLKFPQFGKYNYSHFNSAFQNCKKTINMSISNRKEVNCK